MLARAKARQLKVSRENKYSLGKSSFFLYSILPTADFASLAKILYWIVDIFAL